MRGTYQTRQRRAVLEFLAQHAERQFTVDELLAAMGAAAPGRSTAYRLLDRLAEEGAVRRFLPEGTHTAAYQATATGHCDAHLHLKCVTCGKLIHLDETISDAVQGDLLSRAGFAVDDSRTTIFGTCADCQTGRGDRHA
ncbi:MAG: Fur family transcriptional regulator [Oscillospiraceae bacterium]